VLAPTTCGSMLIAVSCRVDVVADTAYRRAILVHIELILYPLSRPKRSKFCNRVAIGKQDACHERAPTAANKATNKPALAVKCIGALEALRIHIADSAASN
jgi:hypothetical protein